MSQFRAKSSWNTFGNLESFCFRVPENRSGGFCAVSPARIALYEFRARFYESDRRNATRHNVIITSQLIARKSQIDIKVSSENSGLREMFVCTAFSTRHFRPSSRIVFSIDSIRQKEKRRNVMIVKQYRIYLPSLVKISPSECRMTDNSWQRTTTCRRLKLVRTRARERIFPTAFCNAQIDAGHK